MPRSVRFPKEKDRSPGPGSYEDVRLKFKSHSPITRIEERKGLPKTERYFERLALSPGPTNYTIDS